LARILRELRKTFLERLCLRLASLQDALHGGS
jgi:hypothetical protein